MSMGFANGNGAQTISLSLQVTPHPQDPTRMCMITFSTGPALFSLAVDWPSLPKLARALLDGQKNRPLVEVPRIAVK